MVRVMRSKAVLKGTVAALALVATVGTAAAGGFGIREQSAQFLGTAWAGNAAGGGLSSMYWNPATSSQVTGFTTESNFTDLLLSMKDHVTATTPGALIGFGDSGDLGGNNVIPASYLAAPITKDLFLGVSINSPYGLSTEANYVWAGAAQARTSKIFTLNVTPSLAYRVAPGITIGAGLQVEYAKLRLTSGSGVGATLANPFGLSAQTRAEDTGVGFTLGVHLQPLAGTQIGVGYRSSVSHNLEGGITIPALGAFGSLAPSISVPLDTPDTVTASLRQKLMPQLEFLFTAEWTNWSKVDKLSVVCDAVGAPTVCPAVGTQRNKLLNWHDGYMIAGGLEYQMSPALLLRGGVAWEKSPVQNPSERLVSLPDSDRIWLSAGAGYKWSEAISFDFGYAHIFAADGHIDRGGPLVGGPNVGEPVRVIADTSAHADVFSVAMKMKWGGGAPEPLK